MSPFEVYSPESSRQGAVPTVRFLSSGRVHFNAAAGRLLKSSTHLLVLWDPDEIEIGFKPTSAEDPLAFKLTHGDSQSVLTAPGFASKYKIHSQKMRLELRDGIFVAEPSEPIPDGSRAAGF